MQVAHLLSYLCIKILLHRTDGQTVENKLGQETLIAVANWMWTMGQWMLQALIVEWDDRNDNTQ